MATQSRSDPVDVPALRALEAEATPGPWHHQTGSRMVRSGARYVLRCYVDANSEDETFLCALRNAAPALLDAYEEAARLRRDMEAAEEMRRDVAVLSEYVAEHTDGRYAGWRVCESAVGWIGGLRAENARLKARLPDVAACIENAQYAMQWVGNAKESDMDQDRRDAGHAQAHLSAALSMLKELGIASALGGGEGA